ncbi:hypothetical protein LTR50_000841 [Elasticomyces elasticus]|nr:hypothetical protein LTR50_000841 [Elasticomyces elasticus]
MKINSLILAGIAGLGIAVAAVAVPKDMKPLASVSQTISANDYAKLGSNNAGKNADLSTTSSSQCESVRGTEPECYEQPCFAPDSDCAPGSFCICDDVLMKINKRQAPSLIAAIGNASYVFGWELAGAATSQAQLRSACANIVAFGHGKWAAVGLISGYITAAICAASVAGPNPEEAAKQIIPYYTTIFITQILNSFLPGQGDTTTWLCQHLQADLLDGMGFQGQHVRDVVCAAAGFSATPASEGPAPVVDPSDRGSIVSDASLLYAYELASSATSTAQLTSMCQDFGKGFGTTDLARVGLVAPEVASVICGLSAPISVADAQAFITGWSTRIYITQLNAAGNADGWLMYLCADLYTAAMDAVGLDGGLVRAAICGYNNA